jgi:hypothetical protein
MSAELNLPTRRRCSFCRNTGHNITSCNDPRLAEFEQLCIDRNTTLGIIEFRNWLFNYSIDNPNIVKAYAVKYCGCTVRHCLLTCIDHTTSRIRELYSGIQREINSDREFWNTLVFISQTPILIQMINGANTIEELRDGIIFVEMLNRFCDDDLTPSRKFNIQTTVVECLYTNICECNICYESKNKHDFVKLNCGHELCKDCIKQSLQNVRTEQPCCAFCRSEITNLELASQSIQDELNELVIPAAFADVQTN